MNETPFDQFLEVLRSHDSAEKSALVEYLSDEIKPYKLTRLQYSVKKRDFGIEINLDVDISFRFDKQGNLIEIVNHRY